ncbi:glycosyltransferase family 4 protein [Candidatus Pelagibacter sp.]|nr:glycosyltransferase family 4 protein [Candidatus Pelagibacter sp.]
MKIAYLPGAFFPDPGGAQVQAHNLANVMNDKKYKADVILLNKTNIKNTRYKINYLNKLIINFVYFFDYYLRINLSFILVFYLKKILNKEKYDVWHFIFINYKSLLIIKALYKLTQNIIVTFQGADIQIDKKINYGNRNDIKYEKLLRSTLPKVKIFTAISNNIFVDLVNIGVKKNKIVLLPNGIPLKKFISIKKKFKNKKQKKLNLITVARYAEKKKGFDLVPKIVEELNYLKLNFDWTIIGKDTKKLLLNKTININKNKFKIFENLFIQNESFFPAKKLILNYLKSDIYINLSRIESFGITFVEALSANLPVLTFNTKGANEIIIDKYNGYIINGNNIKTFCRKLLSFNKNKNLFKSKPYNSSRKYDLEKLKKEYIKIYQIDL